MLNFISHRELLNFVTFIKNEEEEGGLKELRSILALTKQHLYLLQTLLCKQQLQVMRYIQYH